jgi:hypothetical protein
MSVPVQDPVLAWRKVLNACASAQNSVGGLNPGARQVLMALKSWLIQQGGNPDLAVIPFDKLSSSEVVISAEACTLYAIVAFKDTATATYTKATDHATTSSDTAAEVVLKMAGARRSHVALWLNGLAMAAGITMQGNTTADGGTGSSTDGAAGFCIIGVA